MKRPTTAGVAVFAIVVVLAAAIAAVLLFATDGARAIEVGDRSVSRETVNEELEAVADNEQLVAAVGQEAVSIAPGTIRSTGSTGVIELMVYELLFEQYLEREGERVTAADREEAASLRDAVFGAPYAAFPEWFRERYDQRFATIAAFSRVVGEGLDAEAEAAAVRSTIVREARRAGVSVDPAYGQYVPSQVQIVPHPTPFASAQG